MENDDSLTGDVERDEKNERSGSLCTAKLANDEKHLDVTFEERREKFTNNFIEF